MAIFRITREQAALMLGVSTRTIDRYVKGGKLSYKKVANKILLNEQELHELKKDFEEYHQNPTTEIVNEAQNSVVSTSQASAMAVNAKLEKIIDDKIDKFFLVFQEKDRMLEEKNKVIFMLQQRVSELETKISTMVALPDYNEQKQLATLEKAKLEEKIKQLSHAVRGEKSKNMMFLLLLVGIIVFVVIWYFSLSQGWL